MRIFVGSTLAFFAALSVWALGQCIQFIINGYWNWVPEVYLLVAPLVIGASGIVLGLPLAAILMKRRFTSWWAYCIAGVVVGIVPVELFTLIQINDFLTFDWARITDGGTKPLSSSELAHIYLNAFLYTAIQPTLGPYAGLVGAAGGLAFWASTNRQAANIE
jgi:hypothetical protein